MKLISLGGQAGCGKDTVGNYLVTKLGSNWRRVGFADAVKKIYMDTFGVTWDFIEEWKRKSEIPPGFDKNVRHALQFIGDGFRQIRSTIWIDIALRGDSSKIINDGRYLNEVDTIKKRGGTTVLIWRPSHENDDPNPSESQIKPTVDWFVKSGLEGYVGDKDLPGYTFIYPEHPKVARGGEKLPPGHPHGDTAWEGDALPSGVMSPSLFDYFIRNEGTLEQLYEKADRMLEWYAK